MIRYVTIASALVLSGFSPANGFVIPSVSCPVLLFNSGASRFLTINADTLDLFNSGASRFLTINVDTLDSSFYSSLLMPHIETNVHISPVLVQGRWR